MKMRSRWIALLGLTLGAIYVAKTIQDTQAIEPHIIAKLQNKKSLSPIVILENTLPLALIHSYQSQIIEMTTAFDPNTEITLIHFIEADDKKGVILDKFLEAAGYKKTVDSTRAMYEKSIKADAQTILDAVIFTAQAAKSHKLNYFGWDLTTKGK